ncbi:MAG: hypothetical protein ACREWJ_14410, partial [Rhodoferax sp.]
MKKLHCAKFTSSQGTVGVQSMLGTGNAAFSRASGAGAKGSVLRQIMFNSRHCHATVIKSVNTVMDGRFVTFLI